MKISPAYHAAISVLSLLSILLFGPALECAYAQVPLKIWANDGGDKVTQDELRAHQNPASVVNSVWNGSTISLFGARNEVVSANVVIEAPQQSASNVSVRVSDLRGPGGSLIHASTASGDGVFDWRNREIELFYVRYLQIKGISPNSYASYDERHVPEKMRRPWSGAGIPSGGWMERLNHDKMYPEIAVPAELVPSFTVTAGMNQSIWADIYIPKTAASGVYTGTLSVLQNGSATANLPLQLTVRNFALPDTPSSKTAVAMTPGEVNQRFFGTPYINPASSQGPLCQKIRDRYFQMTHRHKLSLVDTNYEYTGDQPSPSEWVPRLNGSLYTSANGYAGPGAGVGNNIFAIGLYGTWGWKGGSQADMWLRTDNWERWFQNNFPATERFLYLVDESLNYTQTQQWAQWMKNNPGPGRNLASMATADLPTSVTQLPSLSIVASTLFVGDTATWGQAQANVRNRGGKVWLYNGHRPASGSFAIEDDGVALRELPWGQWKQGIDRWFYWESTYYTNIQGGSGQTNLFRNPQTFGPPPSYNSIQGMSSEGYSNGDGVLMYPGTDRFFSADSYGINGPIAGLRIKHWRRGIQDVDYLTLARQINPAAVDQIVNSIVPKVLWNYGIDDPRDPSWKRTDISWSNDPDAWEAARESLADIIEHGTPSQPTPTPVPTGVATSAPASVPATPGDLAAAAVLSNQLQLTWSDASSNEQGFRIERSVDGTTFTQVAQVGANTASYLDLGLAAWTTYAYRIRAFNSSGTSSYSNTTYRTTLTTNGPTPAPTNTVPPAPSGSTTTAPAAPIGLSAAPAAIPQSITLNWTDASTNESGFRIERSSDGVNFTQVAQVGPGLNTYTDSSLAVWTTYAFRVRAFNPAGSSAYAGPVYRTTLTTASTITPTPTPVNTTTQTNIPSSPVNLAAAANAPRTIYLTWSDRSSNEAGFRIERSMDGTNFQQVGEVGAGTVSYTDSSLNAGTTYAYRIRAYNSAGASAPSSMVFRTASSGTTSSAVPTAPSGLTATLIGRNQIDLRWSDNSDNESGFRVERSTDGVNFNLVATVGTGVTTYSNTGLPSWTTFAYRVKSINAAGSSAASSTVYRSTPQ